MNMRLLANIFCLISIISLHKSLAGSINRPLLCPNATWDSNAVTFPGSIFVGSVIFGLMVSLDNKVSYADTDNSRILVWSSESSFPTRILSTDLIYPHEVFVALNDVYVDNGHTNKKVNKWSGNDVNSTVAVFVQHVCFGLYVDIYDSLYCCLYDYHKVIKKLYNSSSLYNTTIVGGTGVAGSNPSSLNSPKGIFVDEELNLYVADWGNHRIQCFPNGQINGIVKAGNGATGTIELNFPTGVALDAKGYLFIADEGSSRIIGSGPNGFRCLFSCSGHGSASNQLAGPVPISFDSFGNIFVGDSGNRRIQKFLLIDNSCEEITTATITVTSTITTTTIVSSTLMTTHTQQSMTTGTESSTLSQNQEESSAQSMNNFPIIVFIGTFLIVHLF